MTNLNVDLLHREVQEFIQANLKSDIPNLVLKGSPFEQIPIKDLAEQILSKSKCQQKLPTWHQTKGIYFPPVLNIEQTSSEITAHYKSELVSGNTLLDVTGGFGVDSLFFSRRIDQVTYCELDENLSNIAAHNFALLDAENVSIKNQDGLSILENSNANFDWIYIDPSRRNDAKSKVFKLEECSPDVTKYLKLFLEYTDNIMIKLSPFLDISVILKSLANVKEIQIIAVKNEVKELLVIVQKGFKAACTLKAVNLINNSQDIFTGSFPSLEEPQLSTIKKYLYEPNSAILKSGLFNEVSSKLNIPKININSHLYTSDLLIDFPGRRFLIINVSNYNRKQIKKDFGAKKANVTVRNFHETVQQIRKKTGIKDGGNDYLFFTRTIDNKAVMIHCKKV